MEWVLHTQTGAPLHSKFCKNSNLRFEWFLLVSSGPKWRELHKDWDSKVLDYWLSSSSNWKTHPKESKFIVSKSSKDLSNQDSKLPNIWNVSNHEDNQEKRHPTLESHVSLLPLPSFATIWNFQIWKVSSQIGARIICNQANSLHLKVISRCGAQEKSFQTPNKDQIRSPTSQRTKIIQSFKFLSNSRVQANDYKKKKETKLQKKKNKK